MAAKLTGSLQLPPMYVVALCTLAVIVGASIIHGAVAADDEIEAVRSVSSATPEAKSEPAVRLPPPIEVPGDVRSIGPQDGTTVDASTSTTSIEDPEPESTSTAPPPPSTQPPSSRVTTTTAPPTPSIRVTQFYLIDARSGARLQQLTSGSVVVSANFPQALSVEAIASAATSSVLFSLNGSPLHLENSAPYDLTSQRVGGTRTWLRRQGRYSLSATPYGGDGATGTRGLAGTIQITIV